MHCSQCSTLRALEKHLVLCESYLWYVSNWWRKLQIKRLTEKRNGFIWNYRRRQNGEGGVEREIKIAHSRWRMTWIFERGTDYTLVYCTEWGILFNSLSRGRDLGGVRLKQAVPHCSLGKWTHWHTVRPKRKRKKKKWLSQHKRATVDREDPSSLLELWWGRTLGRIAEGGTSRKGLLELWGPFTPTRPRQRGGEPGLGSALHFLWGNGPHSSLSLSFYFSPYSSLFLFLSGLGWGSKDFWEVVRNKKKEKKTWALLFLVPPLKIGHKESEYVAHISQDTICSF